VSIEGLLYTAISFLLLLNWPVFLILARAAWAKPRITALTVMAVASGLIAIGLTAYVWAVANAAAGYPVPRETAQTWFRLILLGLGLFPLWFLWLYATERFDDRPKETKQESDERRSTE